MTGLFKDGERLRRSQDFRLVLEEEQPVLVQKNGYGVLTDVLGATIWDALPGTVSGITASVQSRLAASAKMISHCLYVFEKAGIIEPETPGDESPVIPESFSSDKLVSIVVITYNGEEHLQACFESLLGQTYENLEIMAVDNASTDNTVALLKTRFPGIRVLPLRRNRHYAGAVNIGLKNTRGDFVLILNQDTELDRRCISRLMNTAVSDETLAAVVPMMKFFHLRGFINGIGNQIQNHGWGSDSFIGAVDIGQFQDLTEVPSACFGAVLLNRRAVHDVGYLDETYKSFYEDVDWSFRAWLRGWAISPAVSALVFHKFGASYRDHTKLAFAARNRLRFVLKIFEGRVLFGVLKRYIKEDVKNTLSLVKRRQFKLVLSYIRAYISLGLVLPGTLIKRQRIRRHKIKERRELDVLKKNPPFYPDLIHGTRPRIDSGALFGYYGWLISKMRLKE